MMLCVHAIVLLVACHSVMSQERVPGCPLQCTCVYQRSYYTPGTGLHDQIDIQCNRYAANFGASLAEVPDFSLLQSEGRELLISIEQMDFEILPGSAFHGQRIGSLRLLNNPKLRMIEPEVFQDSASEMFSLVIMNHDNLESMALDSIAQLDGLRELALQLKKPLTDGETDDFSLMNLPNLHGLSLEGLQFQPFLYEISNLIELRQLSLIGMHLTEELVASHDSPFNALRNLESLNLGTNAFTTIPEFLKMMDYIRVLSLENNRLGLLQTDFLAENLPTNIVSLNLRNNLIGWLPCQLFRFRNLDYLKLDSEILCFSCDDQEDKISSLYSSCDSPQSWYFDAYTKKPKIADPEYYKAETVPEYTDGYDSIDSIVEAEYEDTTDPEMSHSRISEEVHPSVVTEEDLADYQIPGEDNVIVSEDLAYQSLPGLDGSEGNKKISSDQTQLGGTLNPYVDPNLWETENDLQLQPVGVSRIESSPDYYDYFTEQPDTGNIKTDSAEILKSERIVVTPEPAIKAGTTIGYPLIPELRKKNRTSSEAIDEISRNISETVKKHVDEEPVGLKISGHKTLKNIIESRELENFQASLNTPFPTELTDARNSSIVQPDNQAPYQRVDPYKELIQASSEFGSRDAKDPAPTTVSPEHYSTHTSSYHWHTSSGATYNWRGSETPATEPPLTWQPTLTSTKPPSTTTEKITTTTRLPAYYYYEYFEEQDNDAVQEGSGQTLY